MKLQDASLQVYKKTLSHILFHVFLIFSECITITSSEEALKLGIRKISPQKIARYENTHYDSFPCENYPPEICSRENPPLSKFPAWENYPQWNPYPTYKSYKWKKKQN